MLSRERVTSRYTSYDATMAPKWAMIGWLYSQEDGSNPMINVFFNGSADMVDCDDSIISNVQECLDN